jgi:DNA-binding HxlR family transcriptional regulator
MTIDYDALSFVTRSKYRRLALRELQDRPKTPKEVTEAVGHDHMSHLTRAIQQLREEGLVELLVDEDVEKGRYYGVTNAGEEIADELEERRAERGESPA